MTPIRRVVDESSSPPDTGCLSFPDRVGSPAPSVLPPLLTGYPGVLIRYFHGV